MRRYEERERREREEREQEKETDVREKTRGMKKGCEEEIND